MALPHMVAKRELGYDDRQIYCKLAKKQLLNMFLHEWYFDHPGLYELLNILLVWAENSYLARVILEENIYESEINSIVFLASRICDKRQPPQQDEVMDLVENIQMDTL